MLRRKALYLGCGTMSLVLCNSAAMGQTLPRTDSPAQPSPFPSAATASTGPDDAQNGVAEIIVTAQKFRQSANTVPISITAATGEQLKEAGIRDVSDLAKITPGFNFTYAPSGTPVYTLRGIGFNDSSLSTRQAVAVYTDESPIAFGPETRGTGLDLERVEVLKGPQGTLYGMNSTGGAINYVAAKPTSTLAAGGSATYGRFDQLDFSGYVSGPISSTLSARFAVEHDGRGDWQRSVSRPGDTAGQTNFTNARLSLLWKPTQDLRVLLTANHWVDRSDFQAPQAVALIPNRPANVARTGLLNYPFAERGSRYADWDANSDLARNNRFTSVALRIDYDMSSKITLTSLSTYQNFKYDQLGAVDGVPTQNADFDQFATSETFAEELRLAGQFGGLKFIAGANFQRDTPNENDVELIGQSSALAGSGINTFAVRMKQRMDSYAGFLNAAYTLTPQLSVQGAVRYTKTRIDFAGCLADSGDGTAAARFKVPAGSCVTLLLPSFKSGEVDSRLNEDNVSWKAGLQYNITPRTIIYANVSKGYKAGGYPFINATYSSALDPARQESVLGYEAGFKAGLLGRKLQVNGAAFYYDYRDKQLIGFVIDPTVGREGKLINVPRSRVYGVELQIDAVPVEGLNLSASGSYILSDVLRHYTDTNSDGVLQDFQNSDLPNVPRLQLNGSARYQWTISPNVDMFARTSVNYQGRSFTALGQPISHVVPSYETVDASVGLQSPDGKWRGYVWGRNIFNKTYWVNNWTLIDTRVHYMGMPVTYGATVEFKF